jgi:hypothetical protein
MIGLVEHWIVLIVDWWVALLGEVFGLLVCDSHVHIHILVLNLWQIHIKHWTNGDSFALNSHLRVFLAPLLRVISLLRGVADDLSGFCGGWSPSLVLFDGRLMVSCQSWHNFGSVLLSLRVHWWPHHVAQVRISLLQVINDLIKPAVFFNDLCLWELLFLDILQIGGNLVLFLP